LEGGSIVLVYKFTDVKMRTRGGFQWKLGKARRAPGKSEWLCNEAWLHAYPDKLTASFMWPAHVSDLYVRFFEAEADGEILQDTDGNKLGCTRLTLLRELKPPAISLDVRRRLAIKCAKTSTSSFLSWNSNWQRWADGWLAGERSIETALNYQQPPYMGATYHASEAVIRRSPYACKAAAALAVDRSYASDSFELSEMIREAVKEETNLRRAGLIRTGAK
jgi:hypothetical protein